MEQATIDHLGTDYEPLRDTALALPDQARLIVIRDADELEFANTWTRDVILARIDAIKEFFRGRKARARAVWQDLVDLEKAALDPCEQARKIVDRAVLGFHQEQERKRAEAEAAARRAQQEAERQAVLARAWTAIAAAVSYVATCLDEDERRQKIAKAAEAAGDDRTAEALREEIGRHDPPPPVTEPELPLVVAPPVPFVEIPRAVGGASIRKNYKARAVNMRRLIEFVAANPQYDNLLELNQSAADKLAKALEDNLGRTVPGLEAVNDATVSRRRA